MKMIRRFRRGMAALTIALGVLAATSGTADAHADNEYSAWACGATRPTAGWTVTHAHTVDFQSTHISASCIAYLTASPSNYCSWVGTVWWNGAVSHSAYQGDLC